MEGRVRVKICGVRREEDALLAASAGADAVGVIQVEGTKRFVSLERAKRIFDALPPFVTKVAVVAFDALSEAEMLERVRAFERIGADCLQLHGNESIEMVERLKAETSLKIIKKVGVPALPQSSREEEKHLRELTREILRAARAYERVADAILLDSVPHKGKAKAGEGRESQESVQGGTGVKHEWSISKSVVAALRKPVILAGGLNPENVSEAVREVRPFAVDVSSGVENASGWKDEAKVRKFIFTVKYL
ncbi:MAG: phosphoribosylanthranilate isomerase [Candidatus Methanospirare jalkutatii]|nr:MAG: phosphoribosylanthranilate isomerase [Candidatus Methanospirare jalkutatii]UYZ40339.1 MAG: phosphoribosylanthranilate isomerase [Candidatus Methanospirare jalkutatii]